MAGVLWTMQILNYPPLGLVGRKAFVPYKHAHNRRFGWVLLPGVVVAGVATIGLLAKRPGTIPPWAPVAVGVLLLIVIVSTAALQAPQHARLADGWNERSHRLLVRSNWIGSPRGPPQAA